MRAERILIIEDDQDIAKALTLRLEANGYVVFWVPDGHSVIQAAAKQKPDLIILDLGLPDENGFMVIKRIQQTPFLSAVPVVVLSGRPQHVYKDAALLAGTKAYLEKPIETQELLATIRQFLPKGSTSR